MEGIVAIACIKQVVDGEETRRGGREISYQRIRATEFITLTLTQHHREKDSSIRVRVRARRSGAFFFGFFILFHFILGIIMPADADDGFVDDSDDADCQQAESSATAVDRKVHRKIRLQRPPYNILHDDDG